MAAVAWEWTLLMTTSAGGGSHRVARKGPSAFSPPAVAGYSGVDFAPGPWGPSSTSTPPPTLLGPDGNTYVFAFWNVRAGTTGGVAVDSSVVNSRTGFSVPVGADGNAKAIAFYVWNFGGGEGPNAVLIDALDSATGFIPDDFVNVFPEDGIAHSDVNSLYWKANDGYLNTDTDLKVREKISALDLVGPPWRRFVNWVEVTQLTFPNPNGPTVNNADVTVMPGCVFVAFAVYSTPPPPDAFVVPTYEIYDVWWWIKTRGGKVPPIPPWGPGDPYMQQIAAVMVLAKTADIVAPQLRPSVLKVALEQLTVASATIKQELEKTKKTRG